MANNSETWPVAVAVLIIFVFNVACYAIVRNGALLVVVKRKKGALQIKPQTWFAWDLVDSHDLYTSPLGTPLLALLRSFQSVVFLFVIIYGNVAYGAAGGRFFIYFTNWTFVLFGFTSLFGTLLTLREWKRQQRPAIPCVEQLPPGITPGWNVFSKTYHLLLETVCAASVMLTIFYWVADYVKGSPIRVDNPFKHGVSSFLLLLDLGLSKTPLISHHIQVVVGYGTAYICFLWLYFAGTGTWVYKALDWSKKMNCIYYAALPTLLMLAFFIMFIVVCIRETFSQRSCCCCCQSEVDESDVMAADFVTPKPLSSMVTAKELPSATPAPETPSLTGEEPSPRLTIVMRDHVDASIPCGSPAGEQTQPTLLECSS